MKKSESRSGQVVEFLKVLEDVKIQVEADAFESEDAEMVETLCRNMATVFQLPKGQLITIGGEKKSAEQVQAIYSLIKHENIEHIITSFQEIKYKVKHITTYLRTALYNSVFESSAFWENRVNTALHSQAVPNATRKTN